jgi:hypothetical protein
MHGGIIKQELQEPKNPPQSPFKGRFFEAKALEKSERKAREFD